MSFGGHFDSMQRALDYKEKHQLQVVVPEFLSLHGKWALVFPLQCHVTVRHQTEVD